MIFIGIVTALVFAFVGHHVGFYEGYERAISDINRLLDEDLDG